MSIYDLEERIRGMEQTLDMWDFMAKPYTDEKVLKKFGTVSIDGDDVQITNSAMEEVVKLIAAAKEVIKQAKEKERKTQWDMKVLRQDLEKAQNYAAMSDPRIAGELDKEIQWYEKNEGQEDLVYANTQLMKYCRDRLRSRR